MPKSKTKRRKWQCPICDRRYNIPVTADEPDMCPECRDAPDVKPREVETKETPFVVDSTSSTAEFDSEQPANRAAGQVEIECPTCHQRTHALPQHLRGLGVHCPHCQVVVRWGTGDDPPKVSVADSIPRIASRRFSRRAVVSVVSIVVAVPLLALLYFAVQSNSTTATVIDVEKQAEPNGADANGGLARIAPQIRDDARKVVRLVDDSVVEVEVPDVAIGSGFVVSEGIVATNYHVIETAESATVRFRNGMVAKVTGFTSVLPKSDLVLLQLEKFPETKSIRLASDEPEKGETVLAFGSPKGLAGTVTDGIVSAIRSGEEMADLMSREVYVELLEYDLQAIWIQTSAPISAGNSGGPLVNLKGEVVGINTWMRKGGQNLNFAISASHLRRLFERQHKALSFALLPAPREWTLAQRTQKPEGGGLQRDLAGIRKQLEDDAEYKRKSDKRMAAEERIQQQTTQKAIKSQQTQQALNLINGQIVALRADLTENEKQGTALVASHSRIIADAKATYVIGQRMKNTLAQNRIQASNLNSALARQQSMYQRELIQAGNQVNLRTGVQRIHEPIILGLQRKLRAIQVGSSSLVQQASGLEARIIALDSNARSLQQQIAIKAQQRTAMIAELNGLIESYNRTLGGTN